jgi:DNA-binding NarL/FixJ family response regulator
MAIKVVLYEDNLKLRTSLSHLLGSTDQIALTGSFENCQNIQSQIETLEPEVVIMDIDMPVSNGFEGLKYIRSYTNDIQVIMLTVFDTNEYIFEALKLGANGYLLKTTAPNQIVDAIINVNNGGVPMTASIARKILGFMQEVPKTNTNYNLTKREKEVLENLVKGLSYKMIAAEIGTGIDTVRAHIKNIYQKLHVHSQTEAVAKALKENIV